MTVGVLCMTKDVLSNDTRWQNVLLTCIYLWPFNDAVTSSAASNDRAIHQ
jgi:hypothetical protein